MARGPLRERRQNNGAVTATPTSKSPIPLYTIFTPPPSCNDIVTYDGTSMWQNGIHQTGDAACYPSSFSDVYQSFYTPGICPQSWKSVGSLAHTSGYNAMCCPSSYFLSTATNNVPGFNNFCASLMTTVLTNVYSAPSLTDGPIPLSPKLITLTTAQVSSTTVYADVIQISWASSNTAVMSLMKQQSATATSRSAAIPGSSTTGVPAATSPGSSFSSPEGMSTGAKIAIGVTIPTTIILMATVAAITFLYRRRRKKSVPQPDIPMQDTKDTQFHELHPDYLGQSAPTELDAAAVMELPGTDMRVELGIGTPTANSKMVEYFSPRKRTPRGTPDETPGSLKKDSTSLREI